MYHPLTNNGTLTNNQHEVYRMCYWSAVLVVLMVLCVCWLRYMCDVGIQTCKRMIDLYRLRREFRDYI